MNETVAKKLSWTLVVPLLMLVIHAFVVLSVQNGKSADSSISGLLVFPEIAASSLAVHLLPTPLDRNLECGWGKCLDDDPRPKPLTLMILFAGTGCILFGIIAGYAIDTLFGHASLKALLFSGKVAFASLLVGTFIFSASRPSEKLVAVAQPRPNLKAFADPSFKASQEHYLDGMVYFNKKDYGKAEAEWLEAKKLDKDNVDAQRGLDRLHLLLAKAPGRSPATDCIQHNGNPPPSYMPGMIHFQKQDYDGARALWEKALVERPKDCDTLAGLARIKKLYGGDN